jgi:hypothetical protein
MKDASMQPENDLKKIWQSQPVEPSVMTTLLLRRRVRELHAKTRKQLVGSLVMPIVIVGLYIYAIKQFHYPVVQWLFALAIAWSVAGVYFLNRGMWSAAMPGDAALSTGLEFYRREVGRRCDLFRRLLWWGFLPMVSIIGTFILALVKTGGGAAFPKAMPFITLVVVWIAAYFAIRLREQRELRREIDELNAIEKENR